METATCFYCNLEIVDGREESGWTGLGPDWKTPDGDFGCDANPISGPDGVGGHRTREEALTLLEIVEMDEGRPIGPVAAMRERLYGGDGVGKLDTETDRLLSVVLSDLVLVAKSSDPAMVDRMRHVVVMNIRRLANAIEWGGWPDPMPYLASDKPLSGDVTLKLFNGAVTKDAWDPDSPHFVDDWKPEEREIVADGVQVTYRDHIKLYRGQERGGLLSLHWDGEGFVSYDGAFFGDVLVKASR